MLKVALDKVMELGYNIDGSIYEKLIKGESLEGENNAQVYTAVSEMDAKAAEYLFGNEEIVNKLIERDSGFARKLLSRMKDFAKVMKSVFKGEKGSIASLRQMNKGIRLFEKALATGGETYALEKAYERAAEQESKKGFAQRDPSTVSRKEYEHHYWATANNVLERNELGQLNKAIGNIKNGDYYPQTADGEYMIAVGNVGNKIVFTDGKYDSYSISKVIEIITSDEYRLDDIRRSIYERERNGILTENTHLLKIYVGIDYAFSDFRKKIRHISGDSSVKQDGRGSGGADEGGTNGGVKYNSSETQYSRKTVEYLSYDKVRNENIRELKKQLTKLYEGVEDTIADCVALEVGDTVYYVDSAKDNGDIRVGVRKKITIKDSERRTRYVNNINKESYEKHYGNRTIFERLGVKLDNDSGSVVGRESGKELSVDTKQSENNKGRISDGDGNRGRRLKYSLKENAEQEILDYYGKTCFIGGDTHFRKSI